MFFIKKIFSGKNSANNNIVRIINKADVLHMYKQLLKMKETRPNLDVMQLLMKCYDVDSSTVVSIICDYLRNK